MGRVGTAEQRRSTHRCRGRPGWNGSVYPSRQGRSNLPERRSGPPGWLLVGRAVLAKYQGPVHKQPASRPRRAADVDGLRQASPSPSSWKSPEGGAR